MRESCSVTARTTSELEIADDGPGTGDSTGGGTASSGCASASRSSAGSCGQDGGPRAASCASACRWARSALDDPRPARGRPDARAWRLPEDPQHRT
jgi:hypothetical protein